jgi:hypothetical protein
MSEQPVETAPKSNDKSLVCDVCGRFGAVEFGDRLICQDCYQSCGSCCCESNSEESGA